MAGHPSGWATAALAALTVASAAGFDRVFTTGGWLGPVVAVALLVHAGGWLLRRLGVGAAVAFPVLLAATGLAGIYVVFPHYLSAGLPLHPAWKELDRALSQAQQGMRTMVTPVPALRGFVAMAAWGTGLVAVMGDWLAFRLRSSLLAVVPGLALFVTCCALGTVAGRVWAVALEVAAIAAFVAVHQATVGCWDVIWFGGRRAGAKRWAAGVGAGVSALALAAALLVTPVAPHTEGTGILGWKAGSDAPSNRVTPSPFDQLRPRLLQESAIPVMTVQASVASYWRLTSLDTFNGSSWQADHSYQSFATTLPGVPPPRRGTRQVVDKFQIQKLDSIWLPAAFNPIEVKGGHRVTWDPVSGSLISSQATSNGESYQVVAVQELASLSPEQLEAAPPAPPAILDRYVQLPAIPQRVSQLARSVTAGARTEYGKALALEQFFHQASFVYSTNPPSDDSTDALEAFLFNTRAGYCQQFAGAYGVLARAAGLPTRIAVGFQEGTLDAHGTYHVIDADAHAWPEVYFSGIGWVPFEPTPGRQIPGGVSYTGSTGSTGAPPDTTPTTAGGASSATVPTPPRGHVPAGAPAARARGAKPVAAAATSPLVWLGVAVGAAAAAGAAWVASVSGARRWRWRRRRHQAASGPPAGRVLAAWDEVAETLAWWRLRRRPDETVAEFAARAALNLRGLLGRSCNEAEALSELATLTARAGFAAPGTAGDDPGRARALAERIEHRLWVAAAPARRLARMTDPRQAWGPRTVDGPEPPS